ncbi:uncharacterized protein LOC8071485 [Sorghum bicolor]|nr:uncharacterized protein LOC8071485 [Sorghum bicolor]|eukprot:XP_002442561.2 uncharacterized protein LOC8071485 [Sorghum bicolor]
MLKKEKIKGTPQHPRGPWWAALGLCGLSDSATPRQTLPSPPAAPPPASASSPFAVRNLRGRRLLVRSPRRWRMPLGLTLGSLGRAMRRKRLSSLDILSSKRAPRDYYKGKNCKPTGFHTRKGGYVIVDEKLPRFVVPDLTDFKLKPYVSQCARDLTASTSATSAETTENKS